MRVNTITFLAILAAAASAPLACNSARHVTPSRAARAASAASISAGGRPAPDGATLVPHTSAMHALVSAARARTTSPAAAQVVSRTRTHSAAPGDAAVFPVSPAREGVLGGIGRRGRIARHGFFGDAAGNRAALAAKGGFYPVRVCASELCPETSCTEENSVLLRVAVDGSIAVGTTPGGSVAGPFPAYLGVAVGNFSGDAGHPNATGKVSLSAVQIECPSASQSPTVSPTKVPSPSASPVPSPAHVPKLPTLPEETRPDVFVVYEDESNGFGWFLNGPDAKPIVQMWPLKWRGANAFPNTSYAAVGAADGGNNNTDRVLYETEAEAYEEAKAVKGGIGQKQYTPHYNVESQTLIFVDSVDSIAVFGEENVSIKEAQDIIENLPKVAFQADIISGNPVAPSPSPSPEPSKGKKLSTGAIVGIVIGSVALIGIIAAVVVSRGGARGDAAPPDAYQPLDPNGR